MKILLVEDDIEISDMLKNFLSTENFEVTASYNGKDAMALQKAEAKANQVAGLVNQFFTLAKLEAGDMVMDMENINISELCRENILDFYEILTRKDFNVDITLWHWMEDPRSRRAEGNGLGLAFKKLSDGYRMSIIVSSHIFSEVGSIVDTIGVISKGSLIKEIPIEEVSSMSETYIWLSVEDVKKAAYILSEEISAQLALDGAGINSIGTKSESLEDYFLKITGEGGK